MPAGASGLGRLGRPAGCAEHRGVDRAVGLRPGAAWVEVGREHLVAAAFEDGAEQPSDEAISDDEHAPAGQPLHGAQHTGERLDVGRGRVVDRVRQVERLGRVRPFGESAGDDRRGAERVAGRLVPGQATVAFAAGQVVDERDAPPVELRRHLVTEHRPRGRGADLLDVGAAQPAGEHPDERAVPVRLGHVGEPRLPRLVENDRAHRGIVGPWQ